MNSLSQYSGLLRRFPAFELSYETVSHKKVSVTENSVALAIAVGKKYFLWFTHAEGSSDSACYFVGLDKDKRISSVEPVSNQILCGNGHHLGTVVYGTMCEISGSFPGKTGSLFVETPSLSQENKVFSFENRVFLCEDIYQFKGINLGNLCFGDRIGFLGEFVREVSKDLGNHAVAPLVASTVNPKVASTTVAPQVALPVMWYVSAGSDLSASVLPDLAKIMGYTAHHIQYRTIDKVAPYINVPIQKRVNPTQPTHLAIVSSAQVAQKMTAATVLQPLPRFDYSKPAYRYPAVFSVTADPQLDLYHLYAYSDSRSRFSDRANPQMVRSSGIPGTIDAGDRVVNATEDHYGGTGPVVYCGLAGIQSLRTSVFMNGIFRRIRENENLDLAEESEDEADFENTDMNKYVDLEKVALIECVFSQKHKKWIPVRLAGSLGEKMVHIEKLVSTSGDRLSNGNDQNRYRQGQRNNR